MQSLISNSFVSLSHQRSRNILRIPEQFWNCAEVTILPKTASLSLGMLHLTAEATPKKTIIGYYASWQWYDREKLASPQNMDFTKYTRVNFAFFQTDVEGNLFG